MPQQPLPALQPALLPADPPVIVNQIDAAFGTFLKGLPSAPRVIDMVDSPTPWALPPETDILVTRAIRGWREAPAEAPPLPRLRWVQLYSAGIEIYPDWLKRHCPVSNGRGLTAPQIAEYVLAAILRFEKDLPALRATGPGDWGARQPGGLEGKCLGLIGYGAIGQEVARRAAAFGMRILATRRGAWTGTEPGVLPCASPMEVAAAADHLVLAAPLTPETAGVVSAELLAAVRPGLHLVNIARGGLIDQEALVAALDRGQLAFATLDVTSPEPLPEGHPLWSHPKVLITPHISYLGGAEMERFRAKTAANLARFLEGGTPGDLIEVERGY